MPPFSRDQAMRGINSHSSLRGGHGLQRNNSLHSSLRSMDSGKVPCVCFDLEPEIYFIECRDELAVDILESVWYDEEEVKTMIEDATAVLAGTNKDDIVRGLEHYSYEGSQRRRYERSRASEAVLGEQLRQQAALACESTIYDNADELIAMEYQKVSSLQQQLAYERARNDERDVSEKFLHKPLAAMKNWFRSDRQLAVVQAL